jgi:hypothetical protein
MEAANEAALFLKIPRKSNSPKAPHKVSITDGSSEGSNEDKMKNKKVESSDSHLGIQGQPESINAKSTRGSGSGLSSSALNSPERNPKDNELILRMSPSPERYKRKRSNTFSESPQSGKGKFKSSMAALVMYASMEDNEVEAAKLLTQMGSADKKTKLPDFLANKSPDRMRMAVKEEDSQQGDRGGEGGTPKNDGRDRSSSFDALTATAAAMGKEGNPTVILPLPPMPNKTRSGSGGGDARFPFPDNSESRAGAAAGTRGGIPSARTGTGTGAGIADRQRRTASGRTVVPDFANFATGGVVRNLPSAPVAASNGTARGGFKDLGGPAFESLRIASRGSSIGSVGGLSGGNVRSRAETISDGPSHTVNRMDKVGIYGPEERKARIARFLEKRRNRVWAKKVKYDVRKNFADSRLRIKGRFVKKEDEVALNVMTTLPCGEQQSAGAGAGTGASASQGYGGSSYQDGNAMVMPGSGGKARSGSNSSAGSRR